MKIDDILHIIGDFGFYQKRLFGLLCIPTLNIGNFMMMVIIVLYTPDHRCAIPGLENDTYFVQSYEHQILINQTIPDSKDPILLYDKCHVIDSEHAQFDDNKAVNATLMPCSRWVYDKTVFESTFTSEANLVCDRSLSTSHAQMVFYFGVFTGDIVFGLIADRFGRKLSLYLTILVLLASGLAVVWMSSFVAFVILQFIIGGSNHGFFLISAVIGSEIVGPPKRLYPGVVLNIVFNVGVVILAGLAFFIRRWRYIQLAAVVPVVLYLSYWWLIPESPRWLLNQGRKEEAEVILQRAANVNKRQIPKQAFDSLTAEKDRGAGNILLLFSKPILRKRTLIIFYNWFVVAMMYYGVTMNAGNLGGNFYLNFFLISLASFPGYFLPLVILDRIGRKKAQFMCLNIGGVACLCTIFTVLFGGESLHPLTLTLAMIGKAGSAASFAICYVFSAELYPTVVRNIGVGASSCAARLGAMVAPYIAKSGELIGGQLGKAEPLVIFGGLTVLASLLCLLLPETLNQRLPESIEDGEKFGTSSWKRNDIMNVVDLNEMLKDTDVDRAVS